MIPRTLHYCWFGRGPKPDLVNFCLQSWRRFCPDFEIVEWNEDNFDVASSPIAKAAYDQRKFAFVTDIVRAYCLYHQGGIYLDSDVEIRRPMDEFLVHRAFTGFQQRGVPFTAVWGSEAHHPFAKSVLDYYEVAIPKDVIDTPNTWFVRDIMEQRFGCNSWSDELQTCAEGLMLYPCNYFCLDLPVNYAVHHFAGSWLAKETPAHWSKVVQASFYLDGLRKLEAAGLKLDLKDLNYDADPSFQSDLERVRWHLMQAMLVVRRRLMRSKAPEKAKA